MWTKHNPRVPLKCGMWTQHNAKVPLGVIYYDIRKLSLASLQYYKKIVFMDFLYLDPLAVAVPLGKY